MQTTSKFLLATAATSLFLAGCGETQVRANDHVSRDDTRVSATLNRFGDRDAIRAGGAQVRDGVFVAATPERANNAALLPARFQSASAIRLESRDPMSITEIASRLSEITGIPHLVALGPTGAVVSAADTAQAASELMANSTQANIPGAAAPAQPPKPTIAPSATLVTGSDDSGIRMRPNLRGPMSEVLNEIAATFDVEWSYADGRILFQDYITRQYQLSALPSASTGTTQIGSNGITSSSTISADVWSEITNALGSIAGRGANISIGSGTGLITVTAKVADHDRVENYIKEVNGTIGQQITFDVNVLTVTLDDEDSFGLDLSGAFSGSNKLSLSGSSASAIDEKVGSINIGVVDGNFSIKALASALSRQGKVSVGTRAGATTSNNRMAPIEIVDELAYVKEFQVTDSDNGRLVSPITDTVTTGFQLQLFPRVLNNRELMVQYSVRLSELKGITTFGEGESIVQLPETSTTSFEQQAILKNGQTLILAGFERTRAEVSASGIGKARNIGLGGAKKAQVSKVATVLMITPRQIDRSASIRGSN